MEHRIFANHAHIFPAEVRADGTVGKLQTLMDECGIEKCVCFAPFQAYLDKAGFSGKSNAFLAEAIAPFENLYGFGVIDFSRDDIEEQIEEIVSYGFRGIKLHPAFQEFNIMSEKAQRVYRAAEDRDLFLSFHTGIHWHRIADYQMLLYDEVACHFPRLRFSMEHLGGYHFFREGLAVMVNHSRDERLHTFAGWTTIAMDNDGLFHYWSHSDDELRALVHQTGNDAHIFGLDFPYNDADYVRKAIERIENLAIPEDAKAGILGKNLARELRIDWE